MSTSEILLIRLTDGGSVELRLAPLYANSYWALTPEEAEEFGEAQYQLQEGATYEYGLSDQSFSLQQSEIVSVSKLHAHEGMISPNIYVGRLTIDILRDKEPVGKVELEVRSKKTGYREDYREMLKDIAEKAADLVMSVNSPVDQRFELDTERDSQTLYQQFIFVNALVQGESFQNAIHKINGSPMVRTEVVEEDAPIARSGRLGRREVRQIASASSRMSLPDGHPLKGQMETVPRVLKIHGKRDTTDIVENQFVCYVLDTFQQFAEEMGRHPHASDRLRREAGELSKQLDLLLALPIFHGLSMLTLLPLGSPVLQRKEGYREVLQSWFMFDMAAKLAWSGGEDVFAGGKKDIATLYEYWLFFRLLELLQDIFKIEPQELNKLICSDDGKLELHLRQGRYTVLEGVYDSGVRTLRISFSYNRTFSYSQSHTKQGSWTRQMRPDYTLSIWPDGCSLEQAETEELAVHVHFDAKYRIDQITSLLDGDENTDALDEEKEDQAKGTYKRADLLKMHAYKDAIRRTSGAYILYPGTTNKQFARFHEILPGLGAFAVSPRQRDFGEGKEDGLRQFIVKVTQSLLDRVSQRERMAFHTFDIHKETPHSQVHEAMPEAYGLNRSFIPSEVSLIVGYYRDEAHVKWILENGYNLRTGFGRGSLRLDQQLVGARYLILHGAGSSRTNKLFLLNTQEGPRIISKTDLETRHYPGSPSVDFYLLYKISKPEKEFHGKTWDISKLPEYQPGHASAFPFTTTLEHLMRCVVK
jgi:predicted component of viral defense system (DUF524 family)